MNPNRRRFRRVSFALLVVAAMVVLNMSRWAPRPPAPWRFLAHRGVHQTVRPGEVVDYYTGCNAKIIQPPTHRFIENTLPSMEAAFALGAEMVELDVHVSTDGVPMVFHDAGLDCQTNGSGAPEDHAASELRQLDIGWGYTADGGDTFPLRGSGVGLMPTLDDVLAKLPGRALLIHFKTKRAVDGDLVAERLARLSFVDRARISVYGGEKPCARVTARFPEVRAFGERRARSCLIEYGLLAWTGFVPAACRHTMVVVPMDHAGKLWGWPRRFEARMRAVGSHVILLQRQGGHGIDDQAALARVPNDFGGLVWTNRIETMSSMRESAEQRDRGSSL